MFMYRSYPFDTFALHVSCFANTQGERSKTIRLLNEYNRTTKTSFYFQAQQPNNYFFPKKDVGNARSRTPRKQNST
ncbi:TPA: hypothetical protein DDZ86_03440 [Candidatus Dependentiae bacterium]|nr:hypothetical protein [Candidatus Dependentiae bacterium]